MEKLQNWKQLSDTFVNTEEGWVEAWERDDSVQVFFGKDGVVGFYIMSEDLSLDEITAIAEHAKEVKEK